jgi:AhpD family alkylhydroperoxidase
MSVPTNVSKQHPHLYRLAIDMASRAEAAGLQAGLSAGLLELLKIRVSQLNGCAFCLRQHTHDALAAGESTDRLAVLSAWRETAYFTEVERAALTLSERVTDIGSDASHHITEDTVRPLTDEQVSSVAWLAIALNTFNRIAITSHYEVAPPALEAAAG